jgi:hypothetical protein
MDPIDFTRDQAIARYREMATKPPEETKGSLRNQIEACKRMYALGHEPALARLSELANTAAARTNGRKRDQDAAAKLLSRLLFSVKLDKSKGI